MKHKRKNKEVILKLSNEGRIMDTVLDFIDDNTDIAFIVIAGEKFAATKNRTPGMGAMIHIKMSENSEGENELIGIIIDGAKHAHKNRNIKSFLVKLGLVAMTEFGGEFGIKMMKITDEE